MLWREYKSFVYMVNRKIEIFSARRMQIWIIFTENCLEITQEPTFHIFFEMLPFQIRIYRLSLFPIKLHLVLKILILIFPIRRCFIYILQAIGILMVATLFIEILSVLSVIAFIVFTVCDVSPVVPFWPLNLKFLTRIEFTVRV